ncbi:hypothetical protein V8E51_016777 [Hyaloscypha variabilis]
MDEGFPPLPFSNPTHSVSAKSEKSPQFLFVNELNEKKSKAKSSYGFAVRSHVRKRVMLDQRRQNATSRRHRQLLQRAPSLGPIEHPRNEISPVSVLPERSDLMEVFHLNQGDFEDQSLTFHNCDEPRFAEISNHLVGPRDTHRTASLSLRKSATARGAVERTPLRKLPKYQMPFPSTCWV